MGSRRPSSTIAYFDTNIFDNLIKRTNCISDADEARLHAAVSSGRLKIVVSHTTIRETLAALESRPDIARGQLELITSLADWDRFVRLSSEVLENDVKHFAFNGEAANTPFEKDAAHIRSKLQLIIEGRIGFGELKAVIGEDREYKTGFRDTVRRAKAGTAPELEEFRKANGSRASKNFSKMVWKRRC